MAMYFFLLKDGIHMKCPKHHKITIIIDCPLKKTFFAAFLTKNIDIREDEEDGAIIILKDVLSEGYIHERDENGDKFLNVEQG